MPKIIKPKFLKGRRICIFCNQAGAKISKEHVFGIWLKEFFPRDDKTTHTSAHISWPENFLTKEPIDKREHNQGHVGSRKLRVTCKRCNNEWLSDLETRAQRGLPPLIFGQRCNILPGGQRMLAAWVAKTAMVAEQFQPRERGISQADRTWLMDNLSPPPKNWLIWMGAYNGTAWRDLAIFQNRGRLSPTPVAKPSDAPHYIQATTFGVGHVLFLVVSSTSPAVDDAFGSWEPDGFPQIWPPSERSLLWPPARVLGDPQAYAAANILNAPGVFDHSLDPGADWAFTF